MIRKSLCFDAKKCVGCYACAVACMDQNDIDVVGDGVAYRFVAHVEGKDGGAVRIAHVSMACMHCEAAECDGTMQKCDACYARTRFGYGPACAEICPTGALTFEEVNDAADAKLKRFGRSLV